LRPVGASMSVRENYLRTVEMRGGEWIPCTVGFSPATWHRYRERLEEVVLRHPSIFGGYQRGRRDFDAFGVRRAGNTYRDQWGCLWRYLIDGLQGQVVEHPLEDWAALKSYRAPVDLLDKGPPREGAPAQDWDAVRRRVERARGEGRLTVGHCPHGFMFQRLYYLRGFERLMVDFVREPPGLTELIDLVLDYNMRLIERWLEIGVDVMHFGDDLGTQTRLPINPKVFRKYLTPAYAEMFGAVRAAGSHVYLHTDGHVLEVAGDLIGAGVTVLNPQSRANGVDGIREACRGRVCVDLDMDRQVVLPLGSPRDVRNHIQEAVEKLGSRRGGLMLKADIYPETPLANIEALCQAMEEHLYHYSRRG